MPNCFTLTPKGSRERANLSDVDNAMREHFKVPPDPEHWFCDWYPVIGLLLSLGKSFEDIRKAFNDSESTHMICDWLEANYTVEAWWEPR